MHPEKCSKKRMAERTVVSWTAQISGYTRHCLYRDAVLLFLDMLRANVNPNQFTYGSLIRACTGLRCLLQGLQIQGCIYKSRFSDNLFVQSALVDFHCKCGNIKEAFNLFEMMAERDVASWNAMIGGFASRGFAKKSLHMFCTMMNEGLAPDTFTFRCVLKATSRHSDLKMVRLMHGFVTKSGSKMVRALSGSLIGAYIKCGNLGNAHQLYKSMEKEDLICCTMLLTGYAQQSDYIQEAITLFKELQLLKVKFDNIILCSMVNICAKAASLLGGRQIHALAVKNSKHDVAFENALIDMYVKSGELGDADLVFENMVEKNAITWTSLISGYGKNGRCQEAVLLYQKMVMENALPTDVTFLCLLSACSHSGSTNAAAECLKIMVEKYNIVPRHEHISCMADLLARKGHIQEACDLMCKLGETSNESLQNSILGACRNYDCNLLAKEALNVKLNP